MLLRAPFASLDRYFWHLVSLLDGRGKAAEFRQAGYSAALLPFLVLRAHAAALFYLPRLLRERRRIRRSARLTTREFQALLNEYSISIRQVAAL